MLRIFNINKFIFFIAILTISVNSNLHAQNIQTLRKCAALNEQYNLDAFNLSGVNPDPCTSASIGKIYLNTAQSCYTNHREGCYQDTINRTKCDVSAYDNCMEALTNDPSISDYVRRLNEKVKNQFSSGSSGSNVGTTTEEIISAGRNSGCAGKTGLAAQRCACGSGNLDSSGLVTQGKRAAVNTCLDEIDKNMIDSIYSTKLIELQGNSSLVSDTDMFNSAKTALENDKNRLFEMVQRNRECLNEYDLSSCNGVSTQSIIKASGELPLLKIGGISNPEKCDFNLKADYMFDLKQLAILGKISAGEDQDLKISDTNLLNYYKNQANSGDADKQMYISKLDEYQARIALLAMESLFLGISDMNFDESGKPTGVYNGHAKDSLSNGVNDLWVDVHGKSVYEKTQAIAISLKENRNEFNTNLNNLGHDMFCACMDFKGPDNFSSEKKNKFLNSCTQATDYLARINGERSQSDTLAQRAAEDEANANAIRDENVNKALSEAELAQQQVNDQLDQEISTLKYQLFMTQAMEKRLIFEAQELIYDVDHSAEMEEIRRFLVTRDWYGSNRQYLTHRFSKSNTFSCILNFIVGVRFLGLPFLADNKVGLSISSIAKYGLGDPNVSTSLIEETKAMAYFDQVGFNYGDSPIRIPGVHLYQNVQMTDIQSDLRVYYGSRGNSIMCSNPRSHGILSGCEYTMDCRGYSYQPNNICGVPQPNGMCVQSLFKIPNDSSLFNSIPSTSGTNPSMRPFLTKDDPSQHWFLLDPRFPNRTMIDGNPVKRNLKSFKLGDNNPMNTEATYTSFATDKMLWGIDGVFNRIKDYAKTQSFFYVREPNSQHESSTPSSTDVGSDSVLASAEYDSMEKVLEEFAEYTFRYHFIMPSASPVTLYPTPGIFPYYELLTIALENVSLLGANDVEDLNNIVKDNLDLTTNILDRFTRVNTGAIASSPRYQNVISNISQEIDRIRNTTDSIDQVINANSKNITDFSSELMQAPELFTSTLSNQNGLTSQQLTTLGQSFNAVKQIKEKQKKRTERKNELSKSELGKELLKESNELKNGFNADSFVNKSLSQAAESISNSKLDINANGLGSSMSLGAKRTKKIKNKENESLQNKNFNQGKSYKPYGLNSIKNGINFIAPDLSNSNNGEFKNEKFPDKIVGDQIFGKFGEGDWGEGVHKDRDGLGLFKIVSEKYRRKYPVLLVKKNK
ncbi:MAG: hypothetical protein H6622_13620 [Halobacteriovoraceae bacterium]|nr:hypothetical protein [Halobacteriovoraceae bacterium]